MKEKQAKKNTQQQKFLSIQITNYLIKAIKKILTQLITIINK